MEALTIENVSKSFDGFAALKDVSFSVQAGAVLGIIGSNGAGKTTLVNIISGYEPPTHGDIRVQGKSTIGLAPRALARGGVVRSFQIPQLFDHLSIRENLLVALSIMRGQTPDFWRPHDEPQKIEEAETILQSFGLSDFANSRASETPQGVRKLLDIAMAVVGNPSVVILDEPTSGVSSDEKNRVMELVVTRFRAHHATTVFVEHDMELVEKFSNTVVALYQGEMIGFGAAAEVLANPRVREHVVGAANAHRARGTTC